MWVSRLMLARAHASAKKPINTDTQCGCRICVTLRLECIPTYIVLSVLVRTHGTPCDLYIYVI